MNKKFLLICVGLICSVFSILGFTALPTNVYGTYCQIYRGSGGPMGFAFQLMNPPDSNGTGQIIQGSPVVGTSCPNSFTSTKGTYTMKDDGTFSIYIAGQCGGQGHYTVNPSDSTKMDSFYIHSAEQGAACVDGTYTRQ